MAVAAVGMVPSCATGFSPFKLLYGLEGLVPDEISQVEFSTEAVYFLAVKNHIEQMVDTHNKAMPNDI